MILNRSYQELAEHYGTAIVPARVCKPRDKSAAEASVRFAETWIVAALRDRKFFSLRELNEAVAEKLKELNNRKRLTKQRTCQTRSPSERIIPCNGRVILRAVSKIHGLSEKIH